MGKSEKSFKPNILENLDYKKYINLKMLSHFFCNQLLSVELIDIHYFQVFCVGKNFEVLIVGTNSKCQNLRIMLYMLCICFIMALYHFHFSLPQIINNICSHPSFLFFITINFSSQVYV